MTEKDLVVGKLFTMRKPHYDSQVFGLCNCNTNRLYKQETDFIILLYLGCSWFDHVKREEVMWLIGNKVYRSEDGLLRILKEVK